MSKSLKFSLLLLQSLALMIGMLGVGLTTIPSFAQIRTKPATIDNSESTTEPKQSDSTVKPQQSEEESTEADTSDSNQSLIIIATETEQLQTFMEALEAAQLQETLAQEGPYTIFAPTDAAFKQLPKGMFEKLLQPKNKEVLKQVLMYHIVGKKLMVKDLQTGTVDALGGGLAIQEGDYGIIVNNASIIKKDLESSNGVIHLVNRVLLPENITTSLGEASPEETSPEDTPSETK